MPTLTIKSATLRERHVYDEKTFLRAFGQDLLERGFRLDLPFQTEKAEESLTITQQPPDRVANNNPKLWPLLQRAAACDASALPLILGLLLAEGDDRAQVFQSLEVTMPADSGGNMADYDEMTDRPESRARTATSPGNPGFSERMLTGRQVADRALCGKVLLLMGAREEGL